MRSGGLEIQNRGPVHSVQSPDPKDMVSDLQQLNLGDADGIGTPRASEGEDTPLLPGRVSPGMLEQVVAFGEVEVEDHQDPGLFFQVLKPFHQ